MRKRIYCLFVFMNILNMLHGQNQWIKLEGEAKALMPDSTIYTIATDLNNNVYVGGLFTNDSGYNYVAQWDGTHWSELGGKSALRVKGGIQRLISDANGNIYVSGRFVDNNGYYYVAKWDGKAWSEIGTGKNALKANNFIFSMTTDLSGNLYVAGEFTNKSGYCYIAKWDGTSWSDMTSGSLIAHQSPGNSFTKIAADNSGNIYAIGSFEDTCALGTGFYAILAKWDGSSWSKVGTGNNAIPFKWSVRDFTCDKKGGLYCTGYIGSNTICYKWNGLSWDSIGYGDGVISTDTANNLYMIGSIDKAGYYYFAGRWDGISWKYYAPDYRVSSNYVSNRGSDIAVDCHGLVYCPIKISDPLPNHAGGEYRDVWELNSYTHVSLGYWSNVFNESNTIYKVMGNSAGKVYATHSIDYLHPYSYIAEFDGIKWNELGTKGINGLRANSDITALYIDSINNIYAGGWFTDSLHNRYIAKWDGNAWSELGKSGASIGKHYINNILMDHHGNLYVAGTDSCLSSAFIAKWDGKIWKRIPIPSLLNEICDLSINSHGEVYAVGYIYSTVDQYVKGVAGKITNDSFIDLQYPFIELPHYSNGFYSCAFDTNDILYTGHNPIVRFTGHKWDSTIIKINTVTNPTDYNFNCTNVKIIIDKKNIAYIMSGSVKSVSSYCGIRFDYYEGQSMIHKWDLDSTYSKVGKWGIDSFSNNLIRDIVLDKNGNLLAGGDFKDTAGSYVAINRIGSNVHSQDIKESNSKFIIYPNPSNNIITLVIQGHGLNKVVEIFDIMGREVLQQDAPCCERNYKINVSNLIPGIYVIKVNNQVQKLVINR